MAKLRFKGDEVRRIVEHSLAAPKQISKCRAAGVTLVKDAGIYLMSNGTPSDIVSGTTSFCAYAVGYGEDAGYDKIRDAVGGDDFGETFPWAAEIKKALDDGADEIQINLTAKSASLTAFRRKKVH